MESKPVSCKSVAEYYQVEGKLFEQQYKESLKGTQAETMITVLKKISTVKRLAVKEITADLSASMQLMAKRSFPNAILVADRFHVQQLIGEALSDLRLQTTSSIVLPTLPLNLLMLR